MPSFFRPQVGTAVVSEQVRFKNERGEKLFGTLHLPQQPTTQAVVWGHCFTCSRHTTILRHLCDALAVKGFMALRFDFSGNGQSEGQFAESTYSKQIGEMRTACSQVRQRGASWVAAGGHSQGAMVALLATRHDEQSDLRAVCTLAGRLYGMTPFHFLDNQQRATIQQQGQIEFISRGRQLTLTRAFLADATSYDPREAIGSLTIPGLIVHGDADEIIPVEEAYQAHRLNSKQTRLAVIPEADHMFSRKTHRVQVVDTVVAWMLEQVAAMSVT
jgi:putative redox protein